MKANKSTIEPGDRGIGEGDGEQGGLRGSGAALPASGDDDLDRRLAKLKLTNATGEGGADMDTPRCVFNVELPPALVDEKSDQEVCDMFRTVVADQLMKNYMILHSINPPRGGSIEAGCSTGGGGECHIGGRWTF